MTQYRVGSEGVRIIRPNGSVYSLPPDTVLDELPERYEGTLEAIEEKRRKGYRAKVIRPTEDKAL